MSTVGVVIPNWNDARHLQKCLDSILGQEVGPDEIVIVDDGSTDDSVAVIRKLIQNEPRARLIVHPANYGTIAAGNTGIRAITSDYVLLASSNDFVLPGIFACAKSCFERFPHAGLWSALFIVVDDSGAFLELHPSPIVALEETYFSPAECRRLAYRVGNWFGQPTMIYKRSALLEAGLLDPSFRAMADLTLAWSIAARHGAIFTPQIFGVIRRHGGFGSHTLRDPDVLQSALRSVASRGRELSPELFDSAFLRRFFRRVCFTAIRQSGHWNMGKIALEGTPAAARIMETAGRWVPPNMKAVRVALAFLILCYFDIWPTIFHRFCGKTYILARSWLRGQRVSDLAR